MKKFLFWRPLCAPTAFGYISLCNKPLTFKSVHDSFGSLNFANDNNLVLTSIGSILNSDGVVLKKYSDSMLFPVVGDDFYIQYKLKSRMGKPNLIVRDLHSHKEITTLITDVKLERRFKTKTDFSVDRQLFASKKTDRMILIDNKKHRLRIYALGITKKGISFGNIPKAFVGEKWICKINYPEGTKIIIEDGPENMTFNADSNMLIWKKPTIEGTQDVLLNIIKPGEEEFYKEINIIVKKKSTKAK